MKVSLHIVDSDADFQAFIDSNTTITYICSDRRPLGLDNCVLDAGLACHCLQYCMFIIGHLLDDKTNVLTSSLTPNNISTWSSSMVHQHVMSM